MGLQRLEGKAHNEDMNRIAETAKKKKKKKGLMDKKDGFEEESMDAETEREHMQ